MASKRTDTNDPPREEISLEPADGLSTDLDPHLQELILAHRAGQELSPSVAFATDEGQIRVDVLAKLADPAQPVPGLAVARTIGDIVTGSVEIGSLEEVRSHPNVVSLKAATEVHPALQFSVGEIRCAAAGLRSAFPQRPQAIDGAGAIVGVVDFGCDFNHANFRRTSGATRLLFLWDQRGGPTSLSPAGFGYGRELDASLIDAALSELDPYQALAYLPEPASHGTHVLDIAAGNGRGTGHAGVAPAADLIFVHLAASDFSADESLGNSRRLLEAVDYIFAKADELGRPAVVNLSLGTHGGPHDGSTLVEQGLEALLDLPGRAIVISAGNSFERRSHAQGSVRRGTPRTLAWEIASSDATDNEIEVWYGGGRRLDVTLITPGGTRLGPVAPGRTVNLLFRGVRSGRIIHRQADPNNGDNQIDILLGAAFPKGTWRVELTTPDADPVPFHAWIERDDFGQSAFAAADAAPSHTLGSISCGARTLAVGSYDARVPARNLSSFTSEGPTRDGREKPEVSAPGSGIVAARARGTSTQKSGTSMAAPHVAGLVALLFQAAGRPLTIAETRVAVLEAVRRDPPAGNGWHPRFGRGRVDGVSCLRPFVEAGRPVEVVPAPVAVAAANGHVRESLAELLASLVTAAAGAHSRVRVAIEVEPLAG